MIFLCDEIITFSCGIEIILKPSGSHKLSKCQNLILYNNIIKPCPNNPLILILCNNMNKLWTKNAKFKYT